jgi:hypothetical protein
MLLHYRIQVGYRKMNEIHERKMDISNVDIGVVFERQNEVTNTILYVLSCVSVCLKTQKVLQRPQ